MCYCPSISLLQFFPTLSLSLFLLPSLLTVCYCCSLRLQEVNSMINKRLKDVLFTDQWSDACMERLSPFGYILVSKGLTQRQAH